MIVDDLHATGMATAPLEHEPPLVVDPDGVKSLPFASHSFQPVAWRDSQISQLRGIVEIQELASRRPVKFRRKGPCRSALPVMKEILCQIVSEGENHVTMLS